MEKIKNDDKRQMGEGIRSIRKQRKISLERLSQKTSLSVSFLSQLERGKVNVSVENLRKIAESLEVQVLTFFSGETGNHLGTVTRKGNGPILKVEGSKAYCESLVIKNRANIQASVYSTPPGEGRSTPYVHNGEEMVYVIKGEVTYLLHDQDYHLRAGDSMHFRSEVPHSWKNSGKTESTMIVFNTPPSWD